MQIKRHRQNPIVTPGKYAWRKAAVFNPAVIIEGDKFYMIERAAGGLRPFYCFFGLLVSDDGVNFEHLSEQPIVRPSDLGFPNGSIQDPRLVKIEDTFYLTYALRPLSYGYSPTGVGKPEEHHYDYPEAWNSPHSYLTRSGIMKSKDMVTFEQVAYTTPFDINDRDNILFPEKINGKYVLLRRPEEYVGEQYGTSKQSMWISYSDDLLTWSSPALLATPQQGADWETKKIGGSTPPVKTDAGWLVLYHGVDEANVYRVGAMILDLDKPEIVLARTKNFIMEPEEYYEKFGLYIPNVIFPTANVVKDDELYIYYGCTDTSIALATVNLDSIVEHVLDSQS